MMGPARTGREQRETERLRGPVTGSAQDDYERTKNAPLGTVLVEDYERVCEERDAALDEIVRTVGEYEKRRDALTAERDAAVKALREIEAYALAPQSPGVYDLRARARAALSEVQR